jgi:tetratricopeptide (TPR) repeat protein
MRFMEFRKFFARIAALAFIFAASSAYAQLSEQFSEALALSEQGDALSEQGDANAAIAVYDEIVQRFGQEKAVNVQAVVAGALYKKGWELNTQGKQREAVAVYDEVARRFDRNGKPDTHQEQADPDAMAELLSYVAMIQEQVIYAQSDAAEAMLVLGQKHEAVRRAKAVQARVDASDTVSAVMSFVIWLADAKTPLKTVRDAIQEVGPVEEFNWSFKEIAPVIAKLPKARKQQAECLVGYFDYPEDIASLDACLAQ